MRFTDDYRGVRVLSAYTFTDIDHIRWAVLAEIDEAEVRRSRKGERSLVMGLLGLLYVLALASVRFVLAGSWSEGPGGLAHDIDVPDFSD